MTSEQQEVKGQQVKENNQQAPQHQEAVETPKPVEEKKILCRAPNLLEWNNWDYRA